MGDYHVIHKIEHRLIGLIVQEVDIEDFGSFLVDNNMTLLRTNGRKYSWTNGRTYTMIDWAFMNVNWMLVMPTSEVILLDPRYSDHSLLSLTLAQEDTVKAKTFKFRNHLSQHEKFQEIISKA
ncbi:hypothetical protein FXO37_14991 [Capsicum annuum]|nr:hypothetical protein FXO37_14991 [Capsicum annuum]